MIDLKPCAHCGSGDAKVYAIDTIHTYMHCYAECRACGIRTKGVPISFDYSAKEKVAELWNARVVDCDSCA